MSKDMEQPLKVQCFTKKDFEPLFVGDNSPKLLYVSKIRPDTSAHPRVMHAHEDFVEILLICRGISEYLIHDKKQQIRQGDLLVYNSGVVHDEIPTPGIEISSYCVAIGGLHLPGLRTNALISDDSNPIFPTGDRFEDMRALCAMMFEDLSRGHPEAEACGHYLMHALLCKVLTVIHDKHLTPSEGTIEEPHILGRRIKSYIDQHYMEPLTLESMGKVLHISPYYLAHVFKQMSGYSPIQYLLRRRIGEAQTLLITTKLPISQIAEMVGYETQSYFNLQFSKNVGMPPKKFRQNYIISSEEDGQPDSKKDLTKK